MQRAIATVVVHSQRELVRAGLSTTLLRNQSRAILYGVDDAELADVWVVDACDGSATDLLHRWLSPTGGQHVIGIVDSSVTAAEFARTWPSVTVLLLDATEAEFLNAVASTRSRAATPEEGVRWPGSDVGLTRRESEVLALLALGRTNAEIAEALFINVETVKSHLKRAYRCIGARNRVEAAAWAVERHH